MIDLKIVVVEDDTSSLKSLVELLTLDGFNVKGFSNPVTALKYIKENEVELIISDIKMPEISGIKLLETVKKEFPDIDIILITAFGDIQNAIEAIKKGASDYILKPLNYEELKNSIEKISQIRHLKYLVTLEDKEDVKIVAKSKKMKKVLEDVEKVAKTDTTVLIQGETGVGKELIARLIHKLSKRNSFAFIPINCAAIPKDLLEAELFGFEKGSFTGAVKSKKGKFVLADKGTIFLDEISEMSVELQAKFLRVLEDGIVEVIGSEKPLKTDIRIIAATNRNLEKYVEEGKFREDIYFRLNVYKIVVPPLRERPEDIEELSKFFLDKFAKKYNKKVFSISDNALEKLKNYHFPGNVRELKHIIERAIIHTNNETISEEDIILTQISKQKQEGIIIPYDIPLKEAEKKIIIETLKKYDFNKKKTAEVLGISVRKIELKLKEWGISLKKIKSYY